MVKKSGNYACLRAGILLSLGLHLDEREGGSSLSRSILIKLSRCRPANLQSILRIFRHLSITSQSGGMEELKLERERRAPGQDRKWLLFLPPSPREEGGSLRLSVTGSRFNTLKNVTKMVTKIIPKVQFEKEICINY